MGETYYLLAFETTSSAIGAERSLMPLLPVRVMPTLRQITASCGISLRVEAAAYAALQTALREGVLPRASYRLYRVEAGTALEVKEKEQNNDK